MRELTKYTGQKVGEKRWSSTECFLVNTTKEEIINTYKHIVYNHHSWLYHSIRGLSTNAINENDIKINDYIIISENRFYNMKIGYESAYCLIATEQTKDFGLCACIDIYSRRMTKKLDIERGYTLSDSSFEILEQMFSDRKKIAHYMVFRDRFDRLIRKIILRNISMHFKSVYSPCYNSKNDTFYLQIKDIFGIEDLDIFIICDPKNIYNKTLKLKYENWQYKKNMPNVYHINQVTDDSIMKLIQMNKRSLMNLVKQKKQLPADNLITLYAAAL